MEEKILELRSKGYTYKQIVEELGCSKSTVSYYCNENGKKTVREKQKRLRKQNPLLQKSDRFRNRIHHKRNAFLKEECIPKGSFSYKDILKKFGEETVCYLSGMPINILSDDDYHLDHIIPRSRGGSNALDNLGITTSTANQMKHSLLVEELFEWCKKILEYNGYTVTK